MEAGMTGPRRQPGQFASLGRSDLPTGQRIHQPMTTGIAYPLLALFSFALMGVLHKLGDRVRANPVWVAALTMGLACVMTAMWSATVAGFASVPRPVLWIALPFGLCAALAVWTFQRAV